MGRFINDEMVGEGTYFYANGNKYTGEFLNGKITGKGRLLYATGERYEGTFVNGKKTGKGKFDRDHVPSKASLKARAEKKFGGGEQLSGRTPDLQCAVASGGRQLLAAGIPGDPARSLRGGKRGFSTGDNIV